MNQIIETQRAEIAALCREFGVHRLQIFGSVLRADFDADRSDIDVVAEFEPAGPGQGLGQYFGFKHAMESLLKRPVDVVEMAALRNTRLKRHIQRDLVPLYAAA